MNNIVEAVILAAGQGARMSSWTKNRPKGMIPLANRPIIEILVDGLVSAGVKDIHMVVGYRKNSVMSYFGDGSRFGANIQYSFQDEPTGTLDALKIGMERIQGDFIVVPGDNYVSAASFTSLRNHPREALLSGKADRWSKWGEIEIKFGKPFITFDSPEAYGRIHFTGIMKISKEIGERLIKAGGLHLGEALQHITESSKFEIISSEFWHNIVYPWDLIEGNRLALRDSNQYRSGKIEHNVTIKGDVSIGKGTVIHSGAYLEGPIAIGQNCDIGPNTVIGPSVSIEDNTTVDALCEIKDSIVMKGSNIGSYCSIKGSVLGSNVSFGSHSVAVPSQRNILYFDKEFSISNRGAMIGDDSSISSRAILQGGSILLSGATIGEGEVYNADFQGDNI